MSKDALSRRARWRATVIYRTDAGPVDVPMLLEELADLHDRIEKGPHWDTIVKIEIHRVNHIVSPTLTVEQQATMCGLADAASGERGRCQPGLLAVLVDVGTRPLRAEDVLEMRHCYKLCSNARSREISSKDRAGAENSAIRADK